MQPDLSLDHAALLVRRLDDARAAYQRLGFTLSPHSVHHGRFEPGGRTEAWGTASHCVMLGSGYLELMGVVAPSEYGQALAARVAVREGLHMVALGTPDLLAAHRNLGPFVAGIEPPTVVTREWPTADGTAPAAFRIARLNRRDWPDAELALVEHGSRELLWRDEWLRHRNGAVGLAFIVLASADVAASHARFRRLFGRPNGPCFRLTQGRLTVTDLVGLARRYPGISLADPPYPAAIGIEVKDMARLAATLVANRVPYRVSANGTLWVAPEHAGGTILEFQAAAVAQPNVAPLLKRGDQPGERHAA